MHCLLKSFLGFKNTIPFERIVCYVAQQTVGLFKKVSFEYVIIFKYIMDEEAYILLQEIRINRLN